MLLQLAGPANGEAGWTLFSYCPKVPEVHWKESRQGTPGDFPFSQVLQDWAFGEAMVPLSQDGHLPLHRAKHLRRYPEVRTEQSQSGQRSNGRCRGRASDAGSD